MEAKELMIGDWVCTESDSTPRQISWIRTGEVGLYWNKVVTLPYLVPIPITPEILRKNGFGKWGKNFIYEKDGLYMQIKLGEFARIFREMNSSLNFNRDFYVHTLQHAFRFCGIDKEIEL